MFPPPAAAHESSRFPELFRQELAAAQHPHLPCTCQGVRSAKLADFLDRSHAVDSILFYKLRPCANEAFYEREAEPVFREYVARTCGGGLFREYLRSKYQGVPCPCVAMAESECIESIVLTAEEQALRLYEAELAQRPLAVAQRWASVALEAISQLAPRDDEAAKRRHLAIAKKLRSKGVPAARVRLWIERAKQHQGGGVYSPSSLGKELFGLAKTDPQTVLRRAAGKSKLTFGTWARNNAQYTKPYLRGKSPMLAAEVVAHCRLAEKLKRYGWGVGWQNDCSRKLTELARASHGADWDTLIQLVLED